MNKNGNMNVIKTKINHITGKAVMAIACMLVVTYMLLPTSSFAASGVTTQMSANNVTAAPGDYVTVEVIFSADYLDSVKGQVAYDSDGLQYIKGGDSEGSGGIVYIDGYSDDGKRIVYKLKLKALKAGTYDISTTISEAYNSDGASIQSVGNTISLTVKGDESAKPDETEGSPSGDSDVYEDDSWLPDVIEGADKEDTILFIVTGATALLFIIVLIAIIVRRRRR